MAYPRCSSLQHQVSCVSILPLGLLGDDAHPYRWYLLGRLMVLPRGNPSPGIPPIVPPTIIWRQTQVFKVSNRDSW